MITNCLTLSHKITGEILRWLFLFAIAVSCPLSAQNDNLRFSNEVVEDQYGNPMMPFAKGEIIHRSLYDAGGVAKISPAGVKMMENALSVMAGIISSWPGLQPPRGFRAGFFNNIEEVHNVARYENPDDDPAPLLSGRVELVFHPYFRGENGIPVIDPEINALLAVHFNNPYVVAGSPLISDVYVAPLYVADFHGMPIYQTNRTEVTIIHHRKCGIFVPVSQESYLNTLIAYWQQKIVAAKAEQKIPGNQATMKSVVAEKDARRADMEKAYNELLKYDKVAAENLRKVYFETEAALSGQAAGSDGDISAYDVLGEEIKMHNDIIVRLEAERDALTETEKKEQAWYDASAMEKYNNRSGLVPAYDRADAQALVRVNPGLVNPTENKIQLIALIWYFMGEWGDKPRQLIADGYKFHAGGEGMARLYSDADVWKAVARLPVP